MNRRKFLTGVGAAVASAMVPLPADEPIDVLKPITATEVSALQIDHEAIIAQAMGDIEDRWMSDLAAYGRAYMRKIPNSWIPVRDVEE